MTASATDRCAVFLYFFVIKYLVQHTVRCEESLLPVFLRTMRLLECTVAMMFVRPSVCVSVRPSVCLSGAVVQCDPTVHFSADLSLWLDSPMFWAH